VSKVGGMEDIPPGVAAVLTRSATDVLSHVAIRARNQGVLLATCHDDAAFAALCAQTGHVKVTVAASGDVVLSQAAPAAAAAPRGKAAAAAASAQARPAAAALRAAPRATAWAVPDSGFTREILGGKSNNLQALRAAGPAALPPFVRLPASAALPFGACERALADEANAAVRAKLEELEASLAGDADKDGAVLAQMRAAFDDLVPPPALLTELAAACAAAGIDAGLTRDTDACFAAARAVWASKWSDRAYHSRRANGVPHTALHMGVLVQQVPSPPASPPHPLNGRMGR
jgi:alpha-glucan, water dikinase